MCGIVGQINNAAPVDSGLLEQMRDTMYHRGPDDFGLYISNDKLAGLGHRRLSLLDLSPSGRQPLSNENGTIQVVVNGEIYNYKELKRELELNGHRFSSNSDSEVIVHGYEEWGVNVLQKLKGMFAFGLWDNSKRQLFIARDRFGIKPLYYMIDKDKFIFASEIKAIIKNNEVEKELDFSSVCDFLVYRYVPSPKTIWKNIKKLPPANFLLLNEGLKVRVEKYWTPNTGNRNISEKHAIETVNEMLSKSIDAHTMGDVPIGSFLSGGYDSSALIYYMHKAGYPTSTFSIGFENWNGSEHQYAELVAQHFGTKHRSKILGPSSLDLLGKLAYYYDEPIADISTIPTFEVSKIASENVKAVLSGEGADEIFGGYTWHRSYNAINQSISIWQKLKGTRSPNPVEHYAEAMGMGSFNYNILKEALHIDLHDNIPIPSTWFYEKHIKKSSPVKTFQLLDITSFMGELVLTKIDRASMANSLEVRVPFLDHELVEFLLSLRETVYFKEGKTKHLLRENIKKVMPKKILDRPKQGFVGPDEYYQNYELYKEVLLNGSIIKTGIISQAFIEDLLKNRDHWRLWKILILEKWHESWLSN